MSLAKGENMKKQHVANDSLEAKRNVSKNPFNLVYDGAISKNEKGKVQIEKVFYKIAHKKIAANLYTPPNFSKNKSYAAIVVAHPNGGVKEQVSGLYAQKLAELVGLSL